MANPLTKLKNKKNADSGYDYPDYFETYVNPELQRMTDAILAVWADLGVTVQQAAEGIATLFESLQSIEIDQKQVDRERSRKDVAVKRRQSRGRNRHILPR